jgi:nucleotide-binding universal stress UspA family protein
MTFQKILVPLDGSHLAESVLPMAIQIARVTHAQVILFHVIEKRPPNTVHGDHHLVNEAEAAAYLERIRQAYGEGIPMDQHVHTSAEKHVATSIVEHSKELGVDLIAMCAHGQSGLQQRIFGSIAQDVLASGHVPVLLVSPERDTNATECKCNCILVPLDGDPEHEAGLDIATQLSLSCNASLHLIMVIHELSTLPGEQAASAMLMPATASALLDMDCEEGELYLAELMGKLLDQHIQVTGEVERGDPAKEIVRSAREFSADLIVLATHGKTTQDAFWSGSVTPKIVTQSHLPLLLVPVHTD